MNSQPKHIAVSGNIGAGKTTLAEMLSKHYGWQAEFEQVDGNPYLEDFYKDMSKWAFHLQIFFLNSRFEQIAKVRKGGETVIQDRTIYEDAYIFAKSLYEQGYFEQRDFENYSTLFESMMKFVEPPDLLIYLRSDISKLVKNIETRGRSYESSIRLDYLKGLNKHYEDWINSYKEGKLLIIEVSEIDFVQKSEDFSNIVYRIDAEINSLFS